MKPQFDTLVNHLLDGGFFLEEAVEILEHKLIEQALSRAEGNQSAASKVLGIHRNTMQRKMTEYKLEGAKVRRKPMTRVTRKAAKGRSAS
jgi:DNA-binding NtrC family response regulator